MAYKLKSIRYKDVERKILLQNENGPCPLLAAANALLLAGTITVPSHCLRTDLATLEDVTNMLANHAMGSNDKTTTSIPGTVIAVPDNSFHVDELLQHIPRFQYGMDVNPKFTKITGYEYTSQLTAFDLLGVKLVHGWLVDPQDQETAAAIGTHTYNALVEQVIQGNEASSQLEKINQTQQFLPDGKRTKLSQQATRAMIISHFLDSTAHQLTHYGLQTLYQELRDGELTVFFRNNHFGTLTKHKGILYLLVTDFGYAEAPEIVWEKLDAIDGNTEYVDSNFQQSAAQAAAAQQRVLDQNELQNADYQLALQLSMQQSSTTSTSAPTPAPTGTMVNLPPAAAAGAASAATKPPSLPESYLKSQQHHIAIGVPIQGKPKAPPTPSPHAASPTRSNSAPLAAAASAASLPSPYPSTGSSPTVVQLPPRVASAPSSMAAALPTASVTTPNNNHTNGNDWRTRQEEADRILAMQLQQMSSSTTVSAIPSAAAATPPPAPASSMMNATSLIVGTIPPTDQQRQQSTMSMEESDRLLALQLQQQHQIPATGSAVAVGTGQSTSSSSTGSTPDASSAHQNATAMADHLLAMQIQNFHGDSAGQASNNVRSGSNNPYEDESLALALRLQAQEDEADRIRRQYQGQQQQQEQQQHQFRNPFQNIRDAAQSAIQRPAATVGGPSSTSTANGASGATGADGDKACVIS